MKVTYQPPGGIETLKAELLRWSLKLLLKPVFSPRWSIAFQRRWLHGLSRTSPLPKQVVIEAGTLGGVAGEWLRSTQAPTAPRGVVLYLHGGAYCIGSPATHRALTMRLAQVTGLPVFSLDYRLAPEHRFPAGLHDALAAFRALHALGQPVVLAGDSAGGGLALATAVSLRDAAASVTAARRVQAAALVLLSPWVDLKMAALDSHDAGAAPITAPAGEAMLSAAWARDCAAHYLGHTAADMPLVSPLFAALKDLPPTLIQVGTDEMLHGQALQLHDALQAAQVEVRCEITARRWHVFQSHAGVLRSADDALARIARFAMEPLARTAAAAAAAAAAFDSAFDTTNATPSRFENHGVVILGAGMSGLCAAIKLKRAGRHDFVILEKADGLGGTWWDNTYPGAHVDVPAPVYSFSFAPNPDWSRRFASAPEIQTYMQRLAARHGLLGHLRFGTRVSAAAFDEASGQWSVQTDHAHGAHTTHRARFFICSTGPLSQPHWPDLPGLADFQGQRLHSARWDHGYAMAGQRVAVIGTGSTASQLVPPIAAQAQHLHVFQRTANWVMPRIDRRYFGLDRLLASLPPYAAAVRWCWMHALEFMRRGFDDGTVMRRVLLATAAWHRSSQVPDTELRARLTPTYPLGCKRIIYSNDYLRAFMQPNVELVTDAISRVTAHGIVTADGRERPIDALVCATGFEVAESMSSIHVTGLFGRTLLNTWHQGPEAYHGITVAGFPNMFLMLGPNTATGHTSTLLYIEPQADHAIACMQAVRAGGHRYIDVKADVLRAHNDALQKRLGQSVWAQCRSWYRMDNGKVFALFPGYTREYVDAVRRPDFSAYAFDVAFDVALADSFATTPGAPGRAAAAAVASVHTPVPVPTATAASAATKVVA